MKHLLALFCVSIGLILAPSAAYSQKPADARATPGPEATPTPVSSDIQPSSAAATPSAPATINATPPSAPSTVIVEPDPQKTVINLPPTPFYEVHFNVGAAIGSDGSSSCTPSCMQANGLQVRALSGFANAPASLTIAKTSVDTHVSFEAGFAYGFKSVGDFKLVAELPVVFSPTDVKSGNLSVARSHSSLFLTPAL